MEASFVMMIIHLITFILILIPVLLIIKIIKKPEIKHSKSFLFVLFGFFPLAAYHIIEGLEYFKIHLLPPEGLFGHMIIEHFVLMIALVSFSWFIYIIIN